MWTKSFRISTKMSTFFVKMTKILYHFAFQKNEDINLTNASHKGINPDFLHQTKEELQKLQQDGLIEAT